MPDTLPKNKKLVPIGKAAKVLGVSIDTIRRWDKNGTLKSSRPDGKTRYFSQEDLEKLKLAKKISISEASKRLSISQSTLRRLEDKGLLKPERDKNGKRLYDLKNIEDFLNSDYFIRQNKVEEEILDPIVDENKVSQANSEANPAVEEKSNEKPVEEIHPDPDLKPISRIPEFLAVSVTMFVVLLSFGIRNIMVSSVAKSNQTSPNSEVLGATKETNPKATPTVTPELKLTVTPTVTSIADPEVIMTVKIDDGSSYVNIYQNPTTNSGKIGEAKNGDTFELVSQDPGWYEVKLADGSSGFISAEYIVME